MAPRLLQAVLFSAGLAAAQSTTITANPAPTDGQQDAPYPNAYYPGYEVSYALAGSQANQTSPPKYPSPWMSGSGDWAAAYRLAQNFVRQLTLAEKVNITTGTGWESDRCVGQTGSVPRLGFRGFCNQDSPLGIRFADYNSVFPSGQTIAATWDKRLIYERGYDMGSEFRMKGVDAQLGPVVGPIGRAPEGGRGWEGFSPDPYLSGIAVAATIKGQQDAGVMAITKHYILNEQEHFRQSGEALGYGYNITESLSSNIDDKTLHELYMWPFADAVRAGTAGIMCSYQQINNSYGCHNSYTLNYLLKGELDFQGFVMSDWGAQHGGVSDALAGLDMAMPGDTAFDSGYGFWGTNLTIAVLNGTVPEWRIDDMVTRIMAAYYYVGRDRNTVPINLDSWTLDTFGFEHFIAMENYEEVNEHVDVRGNHGKHIRDAAAKATVLLKNNGTLPLDHSAKFTAIFGDDAGSNPYGPNGCPDRGCDNGTLGIGWGSGTASYPYLVTPADAIQREVQDNGNGVAQFLQNNWATSQILALARQASLAMVFVNADSGEGFISVDGNEGDRNNLTLWKNGDNLIKNVTSQCNNTIVVIHSPGAVLIDSFYDNPNVTAIIWAGMPGQESGNSIVDVLYGKVNPGGKLPFTLGKTRKDYGTDVLYTPNNGNLAPQDAFAEGVFIDYRAFDRANTTPIYEFGYGLSYTTFSVSNLRVESRGDNGYVPSSGNTTAAPVLGSPGNASDYLFPSNIRRIPYYIYPYLNSTDLRNSSGDPNYGINGTIPDGAQDGTPQPIHPAGGAPGGNPGLYDVLFTAYATITNTGTREGDQVPQVYVSLGGPDEPKVVLRGFERLTIAPGQTATFAADLTRRDLSNWDVASQNWVITGYTKTVYVGFSSRDLPLSYQLPLPGGSSGNGTTGTSSSSMSAVPTYAGNLTTTATPIGTGTVPGYVTATYGTPRPYNSTVTVGSSLTA